MIEKKREKNTAPEKALSLVILIEKEEEREERREKREERETQREKDTTAGKEEE